MELAKEQIIIAFQQAEKEVADLHQRTKEGIETARLQVTELVVPPRVSGASLLGNGSAHEEELVVNVERKFTVYTNLHLARTLC